MTNIMVKDFRAAVKAGLKAEEEKKDETGEGGKKYYRVQVGAYSSKENAETMLKKLKAEGFDGYIRYE